MDRNNINMHPGGSWWSSLHVLLIVPESSLPGLPLPLQKRCLFHEVFDQVCPGQVKGLLSASSDHLPGTEPHKVMTRMGKTSLSLVGVSLSLPVGHTVVWQLVVRLAIRLWLFYMYRL